MYDIIIKNGKIIDGTGSPFYVSDISIKDGKIACIKENLMDAKEIIDAYGLCVTPGFIDSHSHSDNAILTFPDQTEKIEQGITTFIGGQCGSTFAPIDINTKEEDAYEICNFGKSTDIYRTMGSFLNIAKDVPQGSNIAVFVGHNALRSAAMGKESRKPQIAEQQKMNELLTEAITNGALVVSFGLIYPPSCYAETNEIITLAKVAASHGALVAAHIRNEGDDLISATEEFIHIIKESGATGILSHHKAAGQKNWRKVKTTLKMINKANSEGADIYLDVYPYTASHTSLSVRLVPKEYHSGGTENLLKVLSDNKKRRELKKLNHETFGDDLSWILITLCPAYPEYEGLHLSEIAKLHGKDVFETAFDMIAESKGVCQACYFTMCEEDVETVMAHPRAMICTDSGIAGNNQVYHPRLRGSFPRVLGSYVRERNVTDIYEMIRKMTSLPAKVYGLKTKGLIAEGMDADICIFDDKKIIDCCEYTEVHKKAKGLNFVILGGEITVQDANYNGKRKGKVLLR